MKKTLSLVLALSMLVGFAGCSNVSSTGTAAASGSAAATSTASTAAGASNGKLKVYGIYKAGDQTWFIDEGAAAKKAVEAAGGEFIYVDAKMSPEEYLKAVDNAIANHASGVLTCVPDQTMSQSVVTKLTNAKIPVVAADDALEANGKKIAPWVGIDAYGIGKINGKWLADYANKNKYASESDVGLLIMTMDTVTSCVPRAKGEEDAFTKDCPNFSKSKIFKADYDGTTDKGNTAAAAVFTAHPEIKTWLVTGANEEGTVGACRALESAGLNKKACVVGLGGYLAKDEFKKASSPMKAATYFSSDSIGTTSFKVLQDKIAGKDVKMETAVSAQIVTPQNYKQVMGAAAN
jgi:L-arabinose transport system substrate-binding protein